MGVVPGLMLAAAVIAGVPAPVVLILGLGLLHPVLGAAALLGAVVHTSVTRRVQSAGASSEAVYHAAVASELRRGATLRLALTDAAARTPELDLSSVVKRLAGGDPLPDVAAVMAPRFVATGDLMRPAVAVAADAGGRATHVFERLARRARSDADAVREQRTATAQARLSAWIVGGLPVVAVAFAAGSGRLQALMAIGPLGIALVGVGAALLGTGLVLVVVIVRRSM